MPFLITDKNREAPQSHSNSNSFLRIVEKVSNSVDSALSVSVYICKKNNGLLLFYFENYYNNIQYKL